MKTTPNAVVQFNVHADDPVRARRFYQRVFGWRFAPWGPPDYHLVTTGTPDEPGIPGALYKRTERGGRALFGYECTVAVANVERTAAAVEASGGRIILPKVTITGVGELIQFVDSEGNVVDAMRYDASVE